MGGLAKEEIESTLHMWWLRIYSVVIIIVGKLNTTSSSDSRDEFFLFCW